MKKTLVISIIALGLSGCTVFQETKKPEVMVIATDRPVLELEPVPGTVDDVWTEQMYNNVRVPGRVYGEVYIPSHRTEVEIQPGRYQKATYPDDRLIRKERGR